MDSHVTASSWKHEHVTVLLFKPPSLSLFLNHKTGKTHICFTHGGKCVNVKNETSGLADQKLCEQLLQFLFSSAALGLCDPDCSLTPAASTAEEHTQLHTH